MDVYAQPWQGVHLLAPILQRASFEQPPPGLVTMLGSSVVPDPVSKDMVMVLETSSWPVAVTACAHAGVANILMHVQQVMAQPATYLLGGLHLDRLEPLPRQNTLEYLAQQPRLRVAAGHCTGEQALSDLRETLEGRLTPLTLGLRLEF